MLIVGFGSGTRKRQREVFHLLTCGMSNDEIAQALTVAKSTVKSHVKAILRKIHAKNRTQAAIWAASTCLTSSSFRAISSAFWIC